MVQTQLRDRGIRDERVLAAMLRVPRHEFVAPEFRARAYEDSPLPIAEGQTISQPFIVALMLEALALRPEHTVLEIGTGGSVSVEPAPGPSTGGTVTFTNNTPTIDPGDWAQVDFHLTTPATLAADRHFRIMPRIASERLVVELLT